MAEIKDDVLNTRIPTSLKKAVRQMAESEGVSMNTITLKALQDYIKSK